MHAPSTSVYGDERAGGDATDTARETRRKARPYYARTGLQDARSPRTNVREYSADTAGY
jgi:hypothetical protein